MPDLAPIPSSPQHRGLAVLQEARGAAVAAMLEAEEREREATNARRRASRLRKTYERLLLEYRGQQRLPGI